MSNVRCSYNSVDFVVPTFSIFLEECKGKIQTPNPNETCSKHTLPPPRILLYSCFTDKAVSKKGASAFFGPDFELTGSEGGSGAGAGEVSNATGGVTVCTCVFVRLFVCVRMCARVRVSLCVCVYAPIRAPCNNPTRVQRHPHTCTRHPYPFTDPPTRMTAPKPTHTPSPTPIRILILVLTPAHIHTHTRTPRRCSSTTKGCGRSSTTTAMR